ncbi:MAG: FIST C-terminal domain-containing protein [Coriobacteriales bacterium]|jgi:hypothetical protein|nr:FIST C-terminal domain-containing protein [Coriobacteriales bacterium]
MGIRMLCAYTEEIDDADDALDELFEQMDEGAFDEHSLGLIACPTDFIDSGVVGALIERLPFDCVGITTMAGASCGGFGKYRLTLIVLTSDDARFAVDATLPLERDNFEANIRESYRRASDVFPGESPDLILGFFPLLQSVGGEEMLIVLDEVCGSVPIWGGLSSGDNMSFDTCRTICNDVIDREVMAMVLIYGDIDPEFIVTSIPDKNIREHKVTITSSDGAVLKTVNDMPFIEYIDRLGVPRDETGGYTRLPLLLDYGDGSKPVALAIYSLNEEEGSAVCGGIMPLGAQIAFGVIDREGILDTAAASLREIRADTTHANALMFPCVTRYLMLSPDSDDEMESVLGQIDATMPYALCYVGGEICPIRTADGRWKNRFHNYTFTACMF